MRNRLTSTTRICLIAALTLLRTHPLFAAEPTVTPQEAMHSGLKQLAEGKPDDAIKSFEQADALADPHRAAAIRESARFNIGLAHAAAKRDADAAKVFQSLADSATNPGIASSAQYQLGLLEHASAVQGMSAKEPAPIDQTIETLTRAERHFRNSLTGETTDDDARRNIDLTQRLIAALKKQQEEQQKQQEQQQQQNKQDKQESQQDKKNQQKSSQQQQQSGEGDGQEQEQTQPQDSQGGQKQQQKKPNSKNPDKQQDPATPSQQDKGKGDKPEQKPPEQQAPQQSQQGEKNGQEKAFDATAAQILDKEKRERATLERILRQLSGRPARVEKDW